MNVNNQVNHGKQLLEKAAILLLLCLLIGATGFLVLLSQFYQHNHIRFENTAQSLGQQLIQRIHQTSSAAETISQQTAKFQRLSFETFTALSSSLQHTYPQLFLLAQVPVIPASDRARLIQRMHSKGFDGFDITNYRGGKWQSVTGRPRYAPISLMYPVMSQSINLLGYDLFSDPQLISAVDKIMERPGSPYSILYTLPEGPDVIAILIAARQAGTAQTSSLVMTLALIKVDDLLPNSIPADWGVKLAQVDSEANEHTLLEKRAKSDTGLLSLFFQPFSIQINTASDEIIYPITFTSTFRLSPLQRKIYLILLGIILLLMGMLAYLFRLIWQYNSRADEAASQLAEYHTELENRVQNRTAKLEAFAYSVSHDLRTPLRSINGFSQILLGDKKLNLDPETHDMLQRIINASQNMGKLIEGLLDFYRISNMNLNTELIDLAPIADEALTQLQFNEPGRKIELEVTPAPPCLADKILMRAVLDNLLGNSWKYSRDTKNARIEFGHIERDGEVIYFIRDNGSGFDMQFASKLFQPFNRLHQTEFEGTGIGLAIVYEIITRHHGRIWPESHPGEGTTIFFTINTE